MAGPQKIRAVKAGATLWSSGDYTFDGSGNIEKIDSTSYQYDPFGRLASWRKENTPQSYDQTSILYDRYGNQLASTISGCTLTGTRWLCYAPVVVANQYSGNRVVGYTYDAAGNVLADGTGRTFAYDAFNMSVSASVAGREFRYIYDASDERVAAVERVPGADGLTRNRTTWTLRGFGNELLSIFSDDATTGTPMLAWKEDEIYRGASLLGIDTPSGARHYALDHLGSPRLVTDASGDKLGEQHFAPFGDGGATGSGALQFTGHERDAATIGGGAVGLPDYMHARFYEPASGRFLSVDPNAFWELQPGSDENRAKFRSYLRHPQRWNRYAYVSNNPINKIDPDGREENFYMEQLFREQQMVGEGQMTEDQYWARRRSEGYGALIGTAGAGGWLLGARAVTAGVAAFQAWRSAATAAGTIKAVEQISRGDARLFRAAVDAAKGTANTFANNLTALAQTIGKMIPGGQVLQIGKINGQAVYGSATTRIGITTIDGTTKVVRMLQDGKYEVLGNFR